MAELQPIDLGFDPARFTSWRPGQYSAIMDAVDCPTRFSGHCAPCGSGKTALIAGFARMTEFRTLILTPFKGLQDQLVREHPYVTDIRGKSNYYCSDLNLNCEQASPRCESRNSALGNMLCEHKSAVAKAQQESIVVTSYSCWLHQLYGTGLGKFDAIIMDEAGQAEGALSEFLSFSLSAREVLHDLHSQSPPHWDESLQKWKDWAVSVLPRLREDFRDTEEVVKKTDDRESLERLFHLRNLLRKISTLGNMYVEDWCGEPTRDGIKFDPIWPGRFAESHLFRGIPRVLLFDATLNRKTLALLRIAKENYTFFDYPSSFHPANAPFYLLPVGDLSHNSLTKNPSLIGDLVRTVDKLTDARMKWKGLLHTVSFAHLEQYIERTSHRSIVSANDIKYTGGSRRTTDVVETFKKSPPPSILASPSLGMGWDFPHDDCRWAAIFKVPFPNATSIVDKERKKLDREYHNHLAMTTLVQTSRRHIRSDLDFGEFYTFDTRLVWFLKNNHHLAPSWFINDNWKTCFRGLNPGVLPEPMRAR